MNMPTSGSAGVVLKGGILPHMCAGNKINSIFTERVISVASKPEIALRTLASAQCFQTSAFLNNTAKVHSCLNTCSQS